MAVLGDELYTGGFFFDVEGYPNGFVARWDASGDVAAATSRAQGFTPQTLPSAAFPNPFSDQLRIEFHTSTTLGATVDIFDLLGRRVTAPELNASTGRLGVLVSTAAWAPGLYTYVIRGGGRLLGRGVVVRGGR